ncbi:MAG TPA: class I SAM-dependent methyltransferase [Rhodothermales bacterium]|nr:class I SAM-dependent methyltransferase [Rhodothermales bacterium]
MAASDTTPRTTVARRELQAPQVVLLLLVLLMAGACSDAPRQGPVADSNSVYQYRPGNDSDGTGKFYMGREIAHVMGHVRADWMERPSRAVDELPNRLVRALDLDSSDVVADIGAGTGYFTFRLSPKVPEGLVLAEDIDPQMLQIIRRRIREHGNTNVRPILGTPTDPNLPDDSVDVALIVDSYHEFSNPYEMMLHVVRALTPGGRLVLVEYRGEDPTIPIKPLHKMTEMQAIKEMEAVGLVWQQTKSILPQQHFMIFEKPGAPPS